MSELSDFRPYTLGRIRGEDIDPIPFPHRFVANVFPEDFYLQLRLNWPSIDEMKSISGTERITDGKYKERNILAVSKKELGKLPEKKRDFWLQAGELLMDKSFMYDIISVFQPYVDQRFQYLKGPIDINPDALIVTDTSNYSIGPHTDVPARIISLLFYCPDDANMSHLGTSIYAPKEPGFSCEHGQHYEFDQFNRVETFQYLPNSMLGFVRTNNSFHGVETIFENHIKRDLLLYHIRTKPEQIRN